MSESLAPHLRKITLLGLLIWSLAALFFLYELFLRTFIGTIASNIISTIHLSAEQLSLVGAAYYLAYSFMQIPVGLLIDRFGIRRLLFLAVLFCASGVFLFAYSHSFWLLFLSRFMMGLGSSFAFVSLLILALNWFPRRNFGFFSGSTQILGAIGPILAGFPLILLLNLTHNNWRLIVSGVAISGLILAVLIAVFVRDFPKGGHAVNKHQIRRPLFEMLKALFTNKQAMWIAVYAYTIWASIALLGALWGTYYLETRGMTRDVAAEVTSVIWLGLAIGSPVIGIISDRIRRRKMPLVLCTLGGVIVSLLIIFVPGHNYWIFSALFFALGFIAGGQTLSFVILAEHVPIFLRATAMGFNNTAVTLGGVTVPPIVGLIVEWMPKVSHVHTTLTYSQRGFTYALLVMPILLIIGTLVAWFKLKEPHVPTIKGPSMHI